MVTVMASDRSECGDFDEIAASSAIRRTPRNDREDFEMRKQIVFLAILFLTFLVWAPTLSTYFSQDDWVFLSHVYKQPFSSVFKHYQETFYRPVGQQLFFFLGSRLFGLEPQGFHLIGLVIHVFNIWLLSKLLNIWNSDRRLKYFLLTFYAINPAHFVALNWLTQMDIEIAVGFGLLTILFWKKTIFSLGLFLAALLSHETVVMLPIAMAIWRFKGPTPMLHRGRTLLKPAIFFCFGILVLIIKYLINPFSPQSDYSLSFDPFGFLTTSKWYVLRALAIPEGIRSLPAWLIILSLIPGLILILMFRQKLARGLGIYLLGVLPVLGFGGHLLSAYAVFGVALMVIELGKNKVRVTKPLWMLSAAMIILSSVGFVYSNYLNHWSTGRGLVSARLTQNYTEADSDGKKQILAASADFTGNAETYFSSMAGKQFKVLDKGISSGIFGWLFYRGNDMTTQFLPDAEFFKDSILAGKFPAWNPWIFAGMPYFLDPQNFLWYPPNYIFLLVPVETGFLLLLIGHLALAGWGVKKILGPLSLTSGLLGTIRSRPEERLVGGLDVPADFSGEKSGYVRRILELLGAGMFVLSPKLVGHIEEGNWTLVIAACWLPVLYLGLKKNKYWLTVLSLSAIIINNLNIGYYAMIFSALYFLLKSSPDRLVISVKVLVKIWVLVVFLTVPRWLPLIIFGGQTVRADLREAPLPLWSWTKIAKSLVFPLAGGHPVLQNEEILYLGVAPILLVLLGILGKMGFRKGVSLLRQGDSLFWSTWLMFIFFVALNNKTPLFHLINKLPGFSLLRITTRPWIFVSLALAIFLPGIINGLVKRSKLLAGAMTIIILLEFAYFDYGIFSRKPVVKKAVPFRFYQTMSSDSVFNRAYCTTGCLDRLTAQKMGIAILGGNNPVQLKSFVEYLQMAGGYKEQGYHPILPPYTVFNQHPQPDANLLAKTATKFVVSPYELKDDKLELIGAERKYMLYKNKVVLDEYRENYFD